jgi:hypothetical protein
MLTLGCTQTVLWDSFTLWHDFVKGMLVPFTSQQKTFSHPTYSTGIVWLAGFISQARSFTSSHVDPQLRAWWHPTRLIGLGVEAELQNISR